MARRRGESPDSNPEPDKGDGLMLREDQLSQEAFANLQAEQTVPDSVMEQFIRSCRATLEAAWAVSDCGGQRSQDNPKAHIGEAFETIQKALIAAVSADGSDAIIGYSLVAQALSRKALRLRSDGNMGGKGQPPPPTGPFGLPIQFFQPPDQD